MKPVSYGKIGILLGGFCFLLVFAAGCLVDEYGTGRDVMVFKVSADGTEEWQTIIDTGGDDTAKTIVQTGDGGYLVGGSVWPWRGDRAPGIFRLDDGGTVVWNATGLREDEPVSSVAETTAGTIVAASGSKILFFDQAGNSLADDDTESDGVIRSVAGTTDGGFVAAGNVDGDALVLKRDLNLTEEWQKTYGADGEDDARTVIQTTDGGYLVSGITETPDRDDYGRWILRLNPAGDLLWNTTLGRTALYDDVDFMESTPEGGCTVVYSNVALEGGRYAGTLKDVTFDHEGNVLSEKAVDAGTPIVKTTDGGYVSGNVTYHTIPRYLIWHDQIGVPRIAKIGSDGSHEWDTALNTTFELIGTPVSVIRTADGGYALLVNRQNYPKEPE